MVEMKEGQSRLTPEENDLIAELSELGLPDRIINVLINERDLPEGKVRLSWVKRLISEYGFQARQLDINVAAGVGREAGKKGTPVRADLVAYRDAEKLKPFVVVETKAPNKKQGVAQAESYSRNLGAEFHLWSDGNYDLSFKTARYASLSEPVTDIPHWVGDKPIVQKVPKSKFLPPFKDEVELRQIIGQCHDLILEKQGHDPAKAFDEMAKLLFLKLYDEREVPDFYEFAVTVNETEKQLAKRLRDLFSDSVFSSKYKDVFFSKFSLTPDVALDLDDFTIFKVVQLLQGYSLVKTTENIQGADIKGTVYEQMVGRTFRGELAQFFTPREIVEFMVDYMNPKKDDKMCDLACGSGGFLVMTIRKVRENIKAGFPNLSESDLKAQVKDFAEHNVFGTDINERMIRVAKMNMIMHGDGHSGIYNTNGFLTDPDIPPEVLAHFRNFQIILMNPPFAGLEKDPAILSAFKLGKNEKDESRSVSKEILFVEKIIDLLAEGGRAGLVLPSGVFNNASGVYARLRALIKEHCKVLALVALPYPAFAVSGATNEGNLIFIQKVKEPPEDYDVFIDWARYVGFDNTGKKIPQNDLPDILKRMKAPKRGNLIKLSELEKEGRWDPWFYYPTYAQLEAALSKSPHKLRPIDELVKPRKEPFSPDPELADVFDYVETNDVDLDEGKIIGSSQITAKTAPSRARYIIREGDFLIPNSIHSIRGIATVSKVEDGFVCTNRFFVVRPNLDEVRPSYLFYMLRQAPVLCLLKRRSTGEISQTIPYSALQKVKIPCPDLPEQDKILKEIMRLESRRNQLIGEIAKHEQEILTVVGDSLPSTMTTTRRNLARQGYDYIAFLTGAFDSNGGSKHTDV